MRSAGENVGIKEYQMDMLPVWITVIGLVAGVAGGMFGIGGGAIMVPAMVLMLGLSQKMATGTSIAAQILPIGLLGAMVYYKEGHVNVKWAVLLALGLLIGFLFGAKLANHKFMTDQMLKKCYGVFLLVIGARYLFLR
jgi:uncharacterized membrane protein YfcA